MERNNFIKKTLSNGIDVFYYVDKNLKRTFFSYNIKFGMNNYFNEFYYQGKKCQITPGIAHFLEHTLIEHSKYGNMLLRLKDLNYVTNGYTSLERTSFLFYGYKQVKESIKMYINAIDEPAFTKENVEKVKYAICEEVRDRLDNIGNMTFQTLRKNLFKEFNFSTVGNFSLGNVESTKTITYEEVKLAYDAYYNNENKFIILAGNFDIDEMTEYLESIYKDLPVHNNELKLLDIKPQKGVRKKEEILYMPTTNRVNCYGIKIVNKTIVDDLKLTLYLKILNMLKLSNSNPEIIDLEANGDLSGGIYFSVDYMLGFVVLIYKYNSNSTEKIKNFIANNLNCDNISETAFNREIKKLIGNEIFGGQDLYRCLVQQYTNAYFDDNMDDINIYKNMTYQEFKEVINAIDFSNDAIVMVEDLKK